MSQVASLAKNVGSALFGIQKLTPAAVPAAPVDDMAAIKARNDAATTAMTDRAMAGRRSMVAAGASIAMDDQASVGLLSQKKRLQMSTDLGL